MGRLVPSVRRRVFATQKRLCFPQKTQAPDGVPMGIPACFRMLVTSPTARCAYGAGLLLEAKKVHLALFPNAPSPLGFES